MQNNRQSSQHLAASDNLDKKVLATEKTLFSLFMVNSSVSAIYLFSSSYKVLRLLNNPNIKLRRVNLNVNKTKLRDALTLACLRNFTYGKHLTKLDTYH